MHIGQTMSNINLNSLGEHLRQLRESKGLLLREVGNDLALDVALLSKFERNERIPSKPQVLSLAKYYHINPDNLLLLWLSKRITDELIDEKLALKAMELAAQRIKIIQKKSHNNP